MNLKNECEGCKAYSDRKLKGACCAWNISRLSKTIKCPCLICLVKGMCVRPCKEFKAYADEVHEKRKKYEIQRSM